MFPFLLLSLGIRAAVCVNICTVGVAVAAVRQLAAVMLLQHPVATHLLTVAADVERHSLPVPA